MRARLADYETAEDSADIAAGEQALVQWDAQGRPAYRLPVARLIGEGRRPVEAFRRYRKLTLPALAKRAGIGAKTLDDIEQGRTEADAKLLTALATVLGTNAASLEAIESD